MTIVYNPFTDNLDYRGASGGPAVGSISVDTFTPPGTNPVEADGSGDILFTGAQVTSSTIGLNVLRTISLSPSEVTYQIQQSGSSALEDTSLNGVAHFDSSHFDVSNGFVSLGGTAAGQTITGNTGGALSPVAGNWNILGDETLGIQTSGTGNTLTISFSDSANKDFSFNSSTAGAARTLTVTNTDNTSTSSAAALNLAVGGTSGGNPYVNFNVPGGQSYSLGAGNTASGYFYLKDNVNFGGNTLFQFRPSSQIYAFGYAQDSNNNALIVSNSGTTDAGSFLRAGIGTSATGDAWLSLLRGSNISYAFGIDTSDNSFLKITTSTGEPTPSTGTMLFRMGSGGILNLPLQPAFLARLSSSSTNVTGDGTTYTVVYDVEVFDQHSDFNGTTTFTTPRDGKYFFTFTHRMSNIGAAHTGGASYIVTSNRTYAQSFNPGASRTSGNTYSTPMSVLTEMDEGDTASTAVLASGSTLTIGITGVSGGFEFTQFSGHLQC